MDQIIGYDVNGDAVIGSVMGDVDGDIDGEVDGDEVGRRGRRHRGRMLALPAKPSWRKGEVAPGLHAPRDGLQILPLTADLNGGVFAPTVTNIVFSARPQKPFRGERLLVTSAHSNATDGNPILGQLFIGNEPQMIEIADFPIEVFTPTAFGVRLTMSPAQPGILIQLRCHTLKTPGVGETIAVFCQILGHAIV